MGIGLDQPSHWLIIAVLAMLLFGYKKMPDMARSAGRSLRIFKTEMKGMADDDDARSAGKTTSAESQAAIAPAPVTPPPTTSTAAPMNVERVQVPTSGTDPTAPPAG